MRKRGASEIEHSKLTIDIGCGESTKEGAIGVDFRRLDSVDIVADATQLPFKDESLDHVYSSHLIEHFAHNQTSAVLREWLRVLKKGGTFEVRCPDLRARAFLFFVNPKWSYVSMIYGKQDYEGNFHRAGFSHGLLRGFLKESGVVNIKRVIKGYRGIPFLPDSLHLIGTKERRPTASDS